MNLLNSREAMKRMQDAGITMSRAGFFQLGIQPASTERHGGNPAYLYDPADIDAKIAEIKAAQPAGLLSVREAVDHINTAYAEAMRERSIDPVTTDQFRHWIHRGQVTPTETRPYGFGHQYYFSEAALEDTPVMRALRRPAVAEMIRVNSTDELLALQQQFGPLIGEEGVLAELRKKKPGITRSAVAARRRRGTLVGVAIFNGGVLYPRSSIASTPQRPAARHAVAAPRG